MTTNGEWLFSKPFDEQVAWMNAEHKYGTLDGIAAALEAEYGKGGLVGGSFIDIPEQGEVVMPLESWRDHLDTESESEDSRERLEADVRNFAEKSGWLYPMAGTRIVLEWLDRQAALTDAEWDDELEQLHMGYKPLIDGLQAQVDELTAERERYREKFGKCLDYADAIHALMDDEGMA